MDLVKFGVDLGEPDKRFALLIWYGAFCKTSKFNKMKQKFKIGAVVNLKSGGPDMTITNDKHGTDTELGEIFNGEYTCSWFDDKGNRNNYTFPQDSLKKSD